MNRHRNIGLLILLTIAAVALYACGGGGGSSAPPTPTVTTDNATGITDVAATLEGSVNPNGLATTYWFEYGTSSTLATYDSTNAGNLAAGTAAQTVTATITGLTYGQTYYYRLVAQNTSGTTNGTILNFNPQPVAPTVVTSAATNQSATGARLNGTVNPNWLASEVWFEYGTSSTLATSTATTHQNVAAGSAAVAANADITGLTPGDTIYFRIVASNSKGTSRGSILNFDTSNPVPTANAGTDNTVEEGTLVTLHGSGTAGFGTITGYEWEQLSGTTVTLTGATTATPTFTAPDVAANAVLRFQLTVTNSQGLTASDNVDITVVWVGHDDDFSANTIASYTVAGDAGTSLTYDGVNDRAVATVPDDTQMDISDTVEASTSGVFQVDFTPTTAYDSHGGIWITLAQDANNYYLISNFDYSGFGTPVPANPDPADLAVDVAIVAKVVGNVIVDYAYLDTTAYTQGTTYNLTFTYSPTQVVLTGFGSTVTLNTANTTAIAVDQFAVSLGQQDSYLDNIRLTGQQ